MKKQTYLLLNSLLILMSSCAFLRPNRTITYQPIVDSTTTLIIQNSKQLRRFKLVLDNGKEWKMHKVRKITIQNIPIGNHTFLIKRKKAEPYIELINHEIVITSDSNSSSIPTTITSTQQSQLNVEIKIHQFQVPKYTTWFKTKRAIKGTVEVIIAIPSLLILYLLIFWCGGYC